MFKRNINLKLAMLLPVVALTSTLSLPAAANLDGDYKIGILLGFTGPIESMTPSIADAAEMALREASDSGHFLGGKTVGSLRGDSTCTDSAAATAAAERLSTVDKVSAIMGADCSGVTTAVANNVAVPNGVVMVSPSATSPALSTIDDQGYFFRTAPSDARQGQVLADIVWSRGINSIAISYTNNDYGKGLSNSFESAYKKIGGVVEMSAGHEDGKADYSAEVAALAASGVEHLAVFGYADQGGKGVIQAALDVGAFDTFVLSDGMIAPSLIDALGDEITGTIGTLPGSESDGALRFQKLASATDVSIETPYTGEAYDAAALIVLAMQAANSSDRTKIKNKILDVANTPGEPIYPGELGKALQILAEGGDVNYVGATDVELSGSGDASGTYKEMLVTKNGFELVAIH